MINTKRKQKINKFEEKINKKYPDVNFTLFTSDCNNIELAFIVVPKKLRHEGIGTTILTKLCKFADKNKMQIYLTPMKKNTGHGTTSRKRLVKFYKRFGFYENKGKWKNFSISYEMIRSCK